MSISFRVGGNAYDHEINLANTNARALFLWLGYAPESVGKLEAVDLAARCRRRLWPEARNNDPAVPADASGGPGTGQARLVFFGREEGYLRRRTQELLKLAETAIEKGIEHVFFD